MLELRVSDITEALAELFFPSTCAFCDVHEPHDRRLCLCKKCLDALRPIPEPICGLCGLPLEGKAVPGRELCGACLTKPPPYNRARFGYRYEGELRDCLIGFKYHQRLEAVGALSELTIRAFHRYLDPADYNLIVPLPLSAKRLRERGFNQSALIVRRLSRHAGISADYTSLRKIRDTKPQARLTREQRKANLRGSFGVRNNEPIKGRSILLVDDVSTTQATLREAARTLNGAKADKVECLTPGLDVTNAVDHIRRRPKSDREKHLLRYESRDNDPLMLTHHPTAYL